MVVGRWEGDRVFGSWELVDSMGTIKTFRDLETWQRGHELVLMIYILTKEFPQRETYSLVDQMRRAVVSITSNVAEGFGRRTSNEKVRFYYIATGSLTEIQNQLLIARDLRYLSKSEYQSAFELTEVVYRLLNGLIRSLTK